MVHLIYLPNQQTLTLTTMLEARSMYKTTVGSLVVDLLVVIDGFVFSSIYRLHVIMRNVSFMSC